MTYAIYSSLKDAWDDTAKDIYEWAQRKGWWEGERNNFELVALMHSELSEAIEALREGNPPSVKASGFSSVEEELADVVIRIMDTAYARGWDVPGAIVAKMEHNEKRPYRHGGKLA